MNDELIERIFVLCAREGIALDHYYTRLALRRLAAKLHGDDVGPFEDQMRAISQWRDKHGIRPKDAA